MCIKCNFNMVDIRVSRAYKRLSVGFTIFTNKVVGMVSLLHMHVFDFPLLEIVGMTSAELTKICKIKYL
jgi:L-asparagine transporter-like permease